MLRIRRGVVVGLDPLEVDVGGDRRRAWSDPALHPDPELGDEVIVNVAAVDLGLGSGGFDIVQANLTRGLQGGEVPDGVHVIKLNYTPLQHPVDPVEEPVDSPARPQRAMPVLVLPLHGHLAPACWSAAGPERRIGFVQGPGGALPGDLSRDVSTLLERGLLCGHVTVGPCYGGGSEAISLAGALHAAAGSLGWDAAIVGPGPGILGSDSRYGHGGMAALDAAHAALALGLPTLISPRLSAGDPRPRHRGLSHHTRSVLDLLLGGVRVPVPEVEAELWPLGAPTGSESALLDQVREACAGRHDLAVEQVDLDGYAASGLPVRTMGRELAEDRLFFAAPLAAGAALAAAIG